MKKLLILSLFVVVISVYLINFKINVHFIPVAFNKAQDKPILEIEIEENKFNLLLDTGMSNDLALIDSHVESIKRKSFLKNVKLIDLKGDVYEASKCELPSIKANNLVFFNVITQAESSASFEELGELFDYGNPSEVIKNTHQGRIGRGFFLRWKCALFNLSRSAIFLSNDVSKIKQLFSNVEFIEIPMEITKFGFIINLKIDLGEKRFLLDTGTNRSLLRNSSVSKDLCKEVYPSIWEYSSEWTYHDNKIGKWDFWLYEFCKEAEFEGILGIDFFKNHILLFDFEKSAVWVSKKTYSFSSNERSFGFLEAFAKLKLPFLESLFQLSARK